MDARTDARTDEIFDLVVTVIDRIVFSTRNRFHVIEGEKLYSSEMHLLLHIGDSAENRRNATRIGEAFGITKGAVSQTLSRLVHKGLLTKETDGASKNELNIHLTEKGWRAYRACSAIREEFSESHARLLEGATDDDKEAVLAYMTRLRDHL